MRMLFRNFRELFVAGGKELSAINPIELYRHCRHPVYDSDQIQHTILPCCTIVIIITYLLLLLLLLFCCLSGLFFYCFVETIVIINIIFHHHIFLLFWLN